jgi:hypothetical protein
MRGIHPSHPWIELDHAPIYVIEYPLGSEPNYFDELAALYAELLNWLKSTPIRHTTISDIRRLNSTARGRQLASEYYQLSKEFEGRYLLGRAYLTANERNRHVITAVMWGSSTEIPRAFFDNLPDALTWAQQLMETAPQPG